MISTNKYAALHIDTFDFNSLCNFSSVATRLLGENRFKHNKRTIHPTFDSDLPRDGIYIERCHCKSMEDINKAILDNPSMNWVNVYLRDISMICHQELVSSILNNLPVKYKESKIAQLSLSRHREGNPGNVTGHKKFIILQNDNQKRPVITLNIHGNVPNLITENPPNITLLNENNSDIYLNVNFVLELNCTLTGLLNSIPKINRLFVERTNPNNNFSMGIELLHSPSPSEICFLSKNSAPSSRIRCNSFIK